MGTRNKQAITYNTHEREHAMLNFLRLILTRFWQTGRDFEPGSMFLKDSNGLVTTCAALVTIVLPGSRPARA